jgi:hypothetical protein
MELMLRQTHSRRKRRQQRESIWEVVLEELHRISGKD